MHIKTILRNILKKLCKIILAFHKPFYIVMVDGGLGSQIFKFALGTCLEEKTHRKVYYDLSWFKTCGLDINNKFSRKFEIEEVFPLVKMETPSKFLLKLTQFCNTYTTNFPHIYDSKIFSMKNIYLDSYFANIQYFNDVREKLLSKLIFSEKFHSYKLPVKKNSIAVHIRLGDYLNSIHDVTTPVYFANAINYYINYYNSDCYFYIFCTSNNFFKQKIEPLLSNKIQYKVILGTDDKGAIDMYKMSECDNFIISNSSFSLFPAWLNKKNGNVIMPSKWHKNTSSNMTKESDKAFILNNAVIMEV